MQDDTTAPRDQSLYQLRIPVRAEESAADAQARLAVFAEDVVPGYRERATFRRTATAKGYARVRERGGVTDSTEGSAGHPALR
ncbi:hypothetical protein [Nocardia sp. NPDC047648]|uniref:hypothetical protein n=1 Tax=Nocardia sp. NPDC047648 TaxID=3155625 RepID=UPI0033D98759